MVHLLLSSIFKGLIRITHLKAFPISSSANLNYGTFIHSAQQKRVGEACEKKPLLAAHVCKPLYEESIPFRMLNFTEKKECNTCQFHLEPLF
jgi:hypothetical protein